MRWQRGQQGARRLGQEGLRSRAYPEQEDHGGLRRDHQGGGGHREHPAELQKADSQAFQDLSDGYKARGTVIQNAGAPPGAEDGAKKLQEAVKQLNALSASYADMKTQVDGLNTKDQAKFATGLKDVSAQMQKVEAQRQTALAALKELESGDTKQALADQPGCKQVSASTGASASATGS